MTIKKLFLIAIPLVLTVPTHATFSNYLRRSFDKMVWQYTVCKVYDRNAGTNTARLYRNVMAGRFAIGAGLMSSISYGGYGFLKQNSQTTTK